MEIEIGMQRAASIAVTSLRVSLCLAVVSSSAASEPGPGARHHSRANTSDLRHSKPRREFTASSCRLTRRSITVDDGDSVFIHWAEAAMTRRCGSWASTTPEIRHDEHGIPLDQSFGPEARAFAQGAFAAATDVKLIRAGDARSLRQDAGLSDHQRQELLGPDRPSSVR